jgi:hypothetical protein
MMTDSCQSFRESFPGENRVKLNFPPRYKTHSTILARRVP